MARHLTLSGGQPPAVHQGLCEAQSDDGKIITADQAAALIRDNAVITVRRPKAAAPQYAVTLLLCMWRTLDS